MWGIKWSITRNCLAKELYGCNEAQRQQTVCKRAFDWSFRSHWNHILLIPQPNFPLGINSRWCSGTWTPLHLPTVGGGTFLASWCTSLTHTTMRYKQPTGTGVIKLTTRSSDLTRRPLSYQFLNKNSEIFWTLFWENTILKHCYALFLNFETRHKATIFTATLLFRLENSHCSSLNLIMGLYL